MKKIIFFAAMITLLFLVGCSSIKIENETFLGDEYSTDGKFVYFVPTLSCQYGEDCAPRIKIKGADLATFEVIGNGYSKDKDDVFLYEKKIKGIDAETFKYLGKYIKDKNFVYLAGEMEKVEGVDAESFEVIDDDYTKDKYNVYFREEKIEGVSPDGLEILDHFYMKSKGLVYYSDGKIANEVRNADLATFEVLGEGYAKDKDNIYYHKEKILGADLESFKVIDEFYAKDKNNEYFEGTIIKGVS